MTWGQIRLILQQYASGMPLDTIDQKLNARYALILSLIDWKGIEKTGVLTTAAAVTVGTATVTAGSTTVTGTGTYWTGAVIGMQLIVPGSPELFTVVGYADPQTLTIDRPFDGYVDGTGLGYQLVQAVYQLPDDCRNLLSITNPLTGLALYEKTLLWAQQQIGWLSTTGFSDYYILLPDLLDPATGQRLAQQIQLYEIPTFAQNYPLWYEAAAPGFDGTNTSASPFDFVSDAALIDGTKADLELEKGTPNMVKVQGFEASFQKHFSGMIHIENARQGPQAIRVDTAYTRHRWRRLERSLGGSYRLDDGP